MRVLLVEDDPATAQGIEMMLRSESYVCDVTDMGDGATFYECLVEVEPV